MGLKLKKLDNNHSVIEIDSNVVYVDFGRIDYETEKVSFTIVVVTDPRFDIPLMSKLLKFNEKISCGKFCFQAPYHDAETLIYFEYSVLGGKHINQYKFNFALSCVVETYHKYVNKINGGKPGGISFQNVLRRAAEKDVNWFKKY